MSQYCVPTALSLVAIISYPCAVADIQEHLGDVPIAGVYFPIALKILKEKYKFEPIRVWKVMSRGLYVISTAGHMFIVRDGIFYDNQFPEGKKFNLAITNKKNYVIYRLEHL